VLYYLGKGRDNTFNIYDSVNGLLFFAYSNQTRAMMLSTGDFTVFDTLRSQNAISYQSSTQLTNVTGTLQPSSLSVLGGATVVQQLTVGGLGQFNGSINANVAITGDRVLANTFVLAGYTIGSFTVNGGQTNGSLNIPQSGQPPLNPQPGAIWFRAGAPAASNTDRAYMYAPNYQGASGKSIDGLPNGWVAISLQTG
jgi:hypothetical protein